MTKMRASIARHEAARQLAHRGTRIQRVVRRIREPIESHRGAARGHHRDDDPYQSLSDRCGRPVVQPMKREERAGQRKRQGEDRVAESDERSVGAKTFHDAVHECQIPQVLRSAIRILLEPADRIWLNSTD